MARKKRKPPAKAPAVHDPVESGAIADEDSLRPDPDQPPVKGVTGRPSVYSEWVNSPPRPSPRMATTNSPPPAAAYPAASMQPSPRPGAGFNAGMPGARRSAGPDLATDVDESQLPVTRKRRTTRARRLTNADRLNVEPEATNLPPVTPPPRAPYVDPYMPPRRATAGPLPSTLGETTIRAAVPPRSTAGAAPVPRRTTAYPAPGPRATTGQPAVARRDTATDLSITQRETIAKAPAIRPRTAPPVERREAPDSSVLIRGSRNPPPTGRIVPRRTGPPSLVMQAIVAVVTVVVLLGALTVSSPLGYGAAVSGTFQAYASSMVWVPTPTPTPSPTPVPPPFAGAPPSPGQQAIITEINTIFGSYAQGALNVSHCESGWDPYARNPYPVGNSHAEGVFQILYPSTWDTTSFASRNPYDADANIRAAWEIFHRDGNSWREWQCQP